MDYGLHISKALKGKLDRCRASTRAAIEKQLKEIAVAAGKKLTHAKKVLQKKPPLRFYVYEGYRVHYHIDTGTRRVVVLDLAPVEY